MHLFRNCVAQCCCQASHVAVAAVTHVGSQSVPEAGALQPARCLHCHTSRIISWSSWPCSSSEITMPLRSFAALQPCHTLYAGARTSLLARLAHDPHNPCRGVTTHRSQCRVCACACNPYLRLKCIPNPPPLRTCSCHQQPGLALGQRFAGALHSGGGSSSSSSSSSSSRGLHYFKRTCLCLTVEAVATAAAVVAAAAATAA